jgi:hypothetical protein
MKWLAEMPSTNARIAVTLLVVVATAATYLMTGRGADGEWLAFLAVMSGIDAAQYVGKRTTYLPTPPAPSTPAPPDREDATATTDAGER